MEKINDIKSYGLKIGKRTFISTAIVLFSVMVFAFVLTQVVPIGIYERTIVDGREVIVAGSYTQTDGKRLPVWRMFTAPIEVFTGPDVYTAVMIILSIMLIGGAFLILDKCGLLQYAIKMIIARFEKKKYLLLAVVTFFGMALGSGMGLFEESVILAPITVALAISLGWDAMIGIGMSVLAIGFGFAASTFNPFTTGVAQRLAGLPLFSGLWLRAIVFVTVYGLLLAFMLMYARRIEKNPKKSVLYGVQISAMSFSGENVNIDPSKSKRALAFFGFCLLFVVSYVTAGGFITELTAFSMPIIALMIAIGGLGAGLLSGHNGVFRDFGRGIVSFLPSAALLMLALSVKQIIVAGGVMDTLLQYAYNVVVESGSLNSLLIIFLFVLFFNFFITGASSKAFLVIPLLAPLAELVDLTRQSIVLAFCFGDGFSNMIYPTNAVLLIVLGIIGVPYMTWFKWTWKLQAVLIAVCVGFLFFAHTIGYGPF